jgi:hypothetical protein
MVKAVRYAVGSNARTARFAILIIIVTMIWLVMHWRM